MSSKHSGAIASVIGIDIGKNSFHIIGQDRRGAIVLRQKWSRGQMEARLANLPPCLIGMEACVGAHHLSRRLQALGHDARLMPAKYVRPYSKGQKNDFRDAEAIAEAVQRPTMKFVARTGMWSRFTRWRMSLSANRCLPAGTCARRLNLQSKRPRCEVRARYGHALFGTLGIILCRMAGNKR
jgi:Transposase